MANSVFPNMAVIVTVFAISRATFIVAKGDVNINPMIVWCNINKFEATDVYYVASLNDVRTILPETNPDLLRRVGGRYFGSENNGVQCFGQASCKDNLVDEDCTQCVKMAVGLIQEKCDSSIGAQIDLPDCKVRYEPYNFIK